MERARLDVNEFCMSTHYLSIYNCIAIGLSFEHELICLINT